MQGTLTVGSARLSWTACGNSQDTQMRERGKMQGTSPLPAGQLFLFACLTHCAENRAGKINVAIGLLCSAKTPYQDRGWVTTAAPTAKWLFWTANICSQEVPRRILAESARFPWGASIAMRPFFTPSSAGYGLIATIWPFICITKVYIHTQVSPYLLWKN